MRFNNSAATSPHLGCAAFSVRAAQQAVKVKYILPVRRAVPSVSFLPPYPPRPFPSDQPTRLLNLMHSPLCGIPVNVEPQVVVVAMVYAVTFGASSYLPPRLPD